MFTTDSPSQHYKCLVPIGVIVNGEWIVDRSCQTSGDRAIYQ